MLIVMGTIDFLSLVVDIASVKKYDWLKPNVALNQEAHEHFHLDL